MKELLSYLFPFFVVCLILFVVTRIWVALVDTVIGWGKRLLHPEGGNKVSVKWHPSSTTEGERRQLALSENIFLLDGTSGSA